MNLFFLNMLRKLTLLIILGMVMAMSTPCEAGTKSAIGTCQIAQVISPAAVEVKAELTEAIQCNLADYQEWSKSLIRKIDYRNFKNTFKKEAPCSNYDGYLAKTCEASYDSVTHTWIETCKLYYVIVTAFTVTCTQTMPVS